MWRKMPGSSCKSIYRLKLLVWRSDLHQFSVDENVYALHHSTPAVELHPYWPENKSGQLRPGWLLWPLVSNRSSTFTRLLLEYFFQVQRWSYGEKPSFSPHRPKSQSSYKLEPWTASQHFQHLSDVPWYKIYVLFSMKRILNIEIAATMFKDVPVAHIDDNVTPEFWRLPNPVPSP